MTSVFSFVVFHWKDSQNPPHAVHLPPLTSTSAHLQGPPFTPPHLHPPSFHLSLSPHSPSAPLISTLNSVALRFTQPHLLTKIPLSLSLCHSVAISAAQINHLSKRKVHITMRGHSISVLECQGDRGYPERRDGGVTAARVPDSDSEVGGVLTKDATMAIKMQMGGQNREWPGCGLHEAA